METLKHPRCPELNGFFKQLIKQIAWSGTDDGVMVRPKNKLGTKNGVCARYVTPRV
jgi:hypothetical protein